jgi:hypothetical protein
MTPFYFLPSWLLAATLLLQRSTPAFSKCGTKDPSPFEQRLDQIRIKHLKNSPQGRRLIADSCEDLCVQCVEVDVYFHLSALPVPTDDGSEQFIFPHPLESVARIYAFDTTVTVDDFASLQDIYNLIDTNMQVLNERYAESPFVFTWKNADPASASVSANPDMVDLVVDTLFDENGVVSELHTGDASVLNVYLTHSQCLPTEEADPDTGEEALDCSIVGVAVFPSYQQANRRADGVYVNYSTLSGGGLPSNDVGLTLVHEVGHWLGLYHTFQNTGEDEGADPCSPENGNDYVADTPVQSASSQDLYECSLTFYAGEELPDSCPDLAGSDPVFNYMNYVSDEECWPPGVGEFTCGQYERMYMQWLLYRQSNEPCQDNESEINILMEISELFSEENAFYLTYVDTGEVVLNSTRDFEVLGPPYQTEVKSDFCAPVGQYSLMLVDSAQNGFLDGGFVEVTVSGELVERVSGNFGEMATINFGNTAGNPGTVPSNSTPSPATESGPTQSPVMNNPPTLSPENGTVPEGGTSQVSDASSHGWSHTTISFVIGWAILCVGIVHM